MSKRLQISRWEDFRKRVGMIRVIEKTFLADGKFNGADLLAWLIAALLLYLFFIYPYFKALENDDFSRKEVTNEDI